MDKFRTADREKTIRNAINGAEAYLNDYPGRTVSLLLANTVTISGITIIEKVYGDKVTVVCTKNEKGFTGGAKTLTVSIQDITAVSEDDADLVTEQTLVARSKEIFDFIMSKYDEGVQTARFTEVNQKFNDDLRQLGNPAELEDKKELVAEALRKNIVVAVSRDIYTAFRPNIDFADMRVYALQRTGLAEFIRPNTYVSEYAFRDAMTA
jgi:hypothetical protein